MHYIGDIMEKIGDIMEKIGDIMTLNLVVYDRELKKRIDAPCYPLWQELMFGPHVIHGLNAAFCSHSHLQPLTFLLLSSYSTVRSPH